MHEQVEVLAEGVWSPEAVEAVWRKERYELDPEARSAALAALAELARRGSPSHDSLSGRVSGVIARPDRLLLDLQPVQWSARLAGDIEASLGTLCAIRDDEGRWLAGRRSPWVAVWPGRWLLGAGGGVGVGENPVTALAREVQEEWSVPCGDDFRFDGVVRVEGTGVWLVGSTTLPTGLVPVPANEYDGWAWWPADPADWPDEADDVNRAIAALVLSGEPVLS